MPGVDVVTLSRPAPSELRDTSSAQYFVVGQTERGNATTYVTVRSMAEFEREFGTRVTYGNVYDDLLAFFGEGGTRANVARVVGPAATSGLLNLMDRAGTPLQTLRVTAASPGAWSTRLTVEVQNGVNTNTFSLIVYLDGVVVERYTELATPAAAVTATARSKYVVVTDLASATVAPNNNPAVLAATALSAGADDRASITSSTYTAALTRFGPELGAGAVSIPGQLASAVGAGLIAHAKAYRRIALLAGARTNTVAQAVTDATALRTTAGAEFAGYFYPHVTVLGADGVARAVSPEGFVAGCRARTNVARGPWRAPAGEAGKARAVFGIDQALTRTQGDTLNAASVNAIRTVQGSPRLYGWRSLSTDALNFTFLTGRDVLNHVAVRAEAVLEAFVFDTIDSSGQLYAEVGEELRAIVAPIATAGGLYARPDPAGGPALDPGYTIDTSPNVNPPSVAGANELRAEVALRVAPLAELVTLNIVKVAFDSPL